MGKANKDLTLEERHQRKLIKVGLIMVLIINGFVVIVCWGIFGPQSILNSALFATLAGIFGYWLGIGMERDKC